jgi:hypothetical protein
MTLWSVLLAVGVMLLLAGAAVGTGALYVLGAVMVVVATTVAVFRLMSSGLEQ